ncbi:MAG: phosphoadenylyl-sulfate reductase [Aeromicrobium sp.]|uniref:phosphoadenylyl-sulfate reductase n=1 Tax=Aeromicrobium sp. TaxID=1871063 RepID=UPI0039E49D9D
MAEATLAERRERQLRHDAEHAEHLARRDGLLSPRRDDAELQAIAEEAERRFDRDDTTTAEVLAWVAETFGLRTAVACSMADAVLPAVVAEHIDWVDTLFLDTGYHFAETLGTRDAVASSMRLNVVDVTALTTVAEQDAEHGPNLHERDPALCCQLRKVEPLTRTLGGYEAWITGVRRDEGPTRANTPWVAWDAKNGLVKINPLANWTFDEVLDYAQTNDIIVNPLVSDGYPSIGCQPCTRRVAPGEDPRAGRWAGFNKTECGLHT